VIIESLPPYHVIASSEILCADPNQFSRNKSSNYADPVAWLAVEAARRALANMPADLGAQDDTAVLAISAQCTIGTIHDIAARAQSGLLSPLHFAGANPGSLAGLVCMNWQFRGPSLALTMPPASGIGTALIVSRNWLRLGQARYVLIIAHEVGAAGHVASCSVLGLGR
jgi:hypothetical protein